MSCPNGELPRYTRAAPPEWEGLVSYAEEQLDGNGNTDVTLLNAFQMSEKVGQLADEPLEANRYYGLGLVMCRFAQVMQTPEVREMTVTRAANMAALLHNITSPNDILRINDLTHLGSSAPFLPAAITAVESMQPASLLAVDTLTAVEFSRRNGDDRPDYDTLQGITNKTLTAKEVAANAIAGTASVLFRSLIIKQGGGAPIGVAANLPLDTGAMRELRIGGVTRSAAKLRIDEFAQHAIRGDKYIQASDDGKIVFRRDLVPDTPPPENQLKQQDAPDPLHLERLGCPAIQVEGLAQLVIEMVPEIVEKFDQTVNASR